MKEVKLTRKQMIQLACGAALFVAGFYCGCKYMSIDRAFVAFCRRPDVEVHYF